MHHFMNVQYAPRRNLASSVVIDSRMVVAWHLSSKVSEMSQNNFAHSKVGSVGS